MFEKKNSLKNDQCFWPGGVDKFRIRSFDQGKKKLYAYKYITGDNFTFRSKSSARAIEESESECARTNLRFVRLFYFIKITREKKIAYARVEKRRLVHMYGTWEE